MSKSEKKGLNFLGPKGPIFKSTYLESLHQIRQLGKNKIFVYHFLIGKNLLQPHVSCLLRTDEQPYLSKETGLHCHSLELSSNSHDLTQATLPSEYGQYAVTIRSNILSPSGMVLDN